MNDDTNAYLERHPLPEPRWLMPLIDVLLAAFAFGLAYFIRYRLQILRPVNEPFQSPFEPYVPYVILYVGLLFLAFQGSRLYRRVRGRAWLDEVSTIINGVMTTTVLLMAVSFVTQPLVFSRLLIIYVAAITIVLLSLARVVQRMIYARMRERGIGVNRVLVVGGGDVGRAVLRTMIARKELGYAPLGYLTDDPAEQADLGRIKALGDLSELPALLRQQPIDTVVITLPWAYHDRILQLVGVCQEADVDVQVVPDVFQLNLRQVQVDNLDGIPLLHVNSFASFPGINRLLKRAIDVGIVVVTAPLWIPLFLLVALAIRIEGPGPIFYSQRRIGENGRDFEMFKFRSMIPNAEKLREELVRQSGQDPRHPKLQNDPRITKVGRVIRALSLDELPNLINVIRGQMSLVGPRPPTPDEVALYEPWHMQRLSIMPGLTGLWQISGRSDVPFDEMCLLDIYYIENWSIKLDAQILMMTIPRVLLRQGAY